MIATLPSNVVSWKAAIAVDSEVDTQAHPLVQSLGCSPDALGDFEKTLRDVAPDGVVEIWSNFEAYEAAETLQKLLGEPRITTDSHG